VSTTAAILSASPGVIAPPASAEGDRLHRRSNVRGALDRRQCEFYRAIAARGQDALEAKPHRSRVAGEGELDCSGRQRFGLTRQKCRGGKRRLLREPICRPAGLPDRPFSYGRPRARPGGLGEIPLAMCIS
jgi:hypothetical protein